MSAKIDPAGTPLTQAELARRIDALPPHDRRIALQAASALYLKRKQSIRSPKTIELENRGWEPWLKTLSPRTFSHPFVPEIRKFWDWYWPLLLAKRDGKSLIDIDSKLAYTLFLGRGMTKSATLEWATIAMGAIVGECLVLYVSSTATLASNHLANITKHIEGANIGEYYPEMAQPRIGKHKNRYGWNKEMLATDSGLTVFAVGLREEIRGVRVGDLRPGLIIPDDFDAIDDSPDVVATKESILGGSIFGTQVTDTIILVGQNLIHRNSIARRIHLGRSELLTYRHSTGVVPAFTDDFEIGTDELGRYTIIKGTPRWEGFNMQTAQKFLDTQGPIIAQAEYQHRFDLDLEGKVFKSYVDKIHVITEQDFCRGMGLEWTPSFRMPATYNKYVFNDKARTKSEYHANVAGTLAVSNQNSRLPGITFLYDMLSFPEASEPEDCAVAILKCITPEINIMGVTYKWEDLVKSLISRNEIAKFTKTRRDEIKAQREGLARIIPEYVHPLLVAYNYQKFRMSHEADDWRTVYRDAFGLPFMPANPGKTGGLAMLNLMGKVDYNVEDPFGRREYDEHGNNIEPLMGMSRFYLIVKKEKLPYPSDAKPDLLHGSDLARYQFTEHRYLEAKLTPSGEQEGDPEKRNDDWTNGLQFFLYDHSLQARELTPGEMQDATLPAPLQAAVIEAEIDPEKRASHTMAREIALRRAAQSQITKQLAGGGGAKKNKLSAYKRLQRRGV
jgi:hypothetical protein